MSQLDDLLLKLPKSTTALIVLLAGIVFIVLSNPPHSICDTEREGVLESLKGPLFATKDKKRTLPALLNRTKSACETGVSSGACFEYFGVLKKIAKAVKSASGECQTEIFETPEIKMSLEKGIELMALMAWGEKAPETQANRTGWFNEGELIEFCQLKDAYIAAAGEEAWVEFRKNVYKKYPLVSKTVADPDSEKASTIEAPKAITTMGEIEIYSKSLFSIQCSYFKAISE